MNSKSVIEFSPPVKYKHYSAVETYGTHNIPMRAEVGVLTRNIIIQGDENSYKEKYGAHLMFHGSAN